MKINFPLPTDGQLHKYCPGCYSENVHRVYEGERRFYFCDNCQNKSQRLIVIDPKMIWWIDETTKEFWHESAGVIVFDTENKMLLFERTSFPFAFTIPAGHVDTGENALTAAKRELEEETGIKTDALTLFSEEDIVGDKCARGADSHQWHLYTFKTHNPKDVKISDEGVRPVWLTIPEALQKELTFAAKYFIEKYGDKLLT